MAIAAMTSVTTKAVQVHLGQITQAADRGSVIAKDQAVHILVRLMADPDLADETAPALLARLQQAAINQLPMYAELANPVLADGYAEQLANILKTRLAETMPDSKRRRVEKVLMSLIGGNDGARGQI